MAVNPVINALGRKLRLGVIGGGPGSFIGIVHRGAATLEEYYDVVAGVFSSNPDKSIASAEQLGIDRGYANPEEMGDQFVIREARLQDEKNRQNSVEIDDGLAIHLEWSIKQQEVIDKAKEAYDWAIENGIAKEQARVVLPEGNTKTRLYMNGTIRSWVHYIELRSANGTQKEHMEVAYACARIIADIFPLAGDLVQDATL